jgi:hypothetical protein
MNRVSTRGRSFLRSHSYSVHNICFTRGDRIQQGDSPIEVLIWMINQCIPVLKQASSFQQKQKRNPSRWVKPRVDTVSKTNLKKECDK